jgi:glycosyltransferase involved in cell wall biosynthesis
MKVLFDHWGRFPLQQGGFQVQIEQTKAALERTGVEVEFLRWWDSAQKGDIIHYFGLPPSMYADLARKKNIRFVITHLLGGLGARSAWKRLLQSFIVRGAQYALPVALLERIGFAAWQNADAYIAITSWEARLMTQVFGAKPSLVHVVPNGVADTFFGPSIEPRTQWLVSTSSIFPVKRILETAHAAVAAKTPYWVIGRPLSESDEYFRKFSELCGNHPDVLRHENVMRSHTDLAGIYRQARGFVLLSRWETQSLSALEAAAAECPLLLSDLQWAHATFGDTVRYCQIAPVNETARCLRDFYDEAPSLGPPVKPARWSEVAERLQHIYQTVVKK